MKNKFKIMNLFLALALFANANSIFAEVEKLDQREAATISTETLNSDLFDAQTVVESNLVVDAAEQVKWDNLAKNLFGEESLLKDYAINGFISVFAVGSLLGKFDNKIESYCDKHSRDARGNLIVAIVIASIVLGRSISYLFDLAKEKGCQILRNKKNLNYLLNENLHSFPLELQNDIEHLRAVKTLNEQEIKLLEIYKKVAQTMTKIEISKLTKVINYVSKYCLLFGSGCLGFSVGFRCFYNPKSNMVEYQRVYVS